MVTQEHASRKACPRLSLTKLMHELLVVSGLQVDQFYVCRQVFMPFSLQLRHTKGSRTSGQDLRLQAPEIHALLDSREFLTFVDVVRYDLKPPAALLHVMPADKSMCEMWRVLWQLRSWCMYVIASVLRRNQLYLGSGM
jgi:hypothetical protein